VPRLEDLTSNYHVDTLGPSRKTLAADGAPGVAHAGVARIGGPATLEWRAEGALTQPEDARRLYDRLSPAYDRLAEASEHGVRALGLQALPLRGGDTVLELGCGTGHGLVSLARAVGRMGTAIGLDVSAGMLARARRHLAAADARAPLVRGDAVRLCLAPAVVDAVFMSFTLELFAARIPDVLAEIWRVLRPGGRVGLVTMARTAHGTPMTHVYEWAHRHWPHLVDCQPIDAVGALRAAGFAVEAVASASVRALPVAIAVAVRPAQARRAAGRPRP
jgi:demethylmenaquinone methyltransferase/2-methoxy-6-polyprenyl-1,4-benzoquinol methylase